MTARDNAMQMLGAAGNPSHPVAHQQVLASIGNGHALLAIADSIDKLAQELVASQHANPLSPMVTGAEVDDALSTLASLSGRDRTDILRDARSAYVVAANNATDLPTFRRVHDASDILRRAGYLR